MISETNLKNLVVYVSDSLRYDYLPDSIASEGQVARVIAQSTHTPSSFASIVTGLKVGNHGVYDWDDRLEGVETIFDLFPHFEYYDHPSDPMRRILGFEMGKKPKELEKMKEPFVWLERAMDTHQPYGMIGHGNEIPEEFEDGGEYISSLKKGELNPVREYRKGVKKAEEHFWNHVEDLRNMGIFEDTLVVFTSDHGEILSRWYPDVHNRPPSRELVEVPAVFLTSRQLPEISKCMKMIDLVPSALDLMGKKKVLGQGISRVGETEEVRGKARYRDTETEWVCCEGSFRTASPLKVGYHKAKEIGMKLVKDVLRKW